MQALQAAGNTATEAARRSKEEEEADGRRRAEEEEDQIRDELQLDWEQEKHHREMQRDASAERESAPERAHDRGSPFSLPRLPDTPKSGESHAGMEESPQHRTVPLSPPVFPRPQEYSETPKRGTRGDGDEQHQTPTMGGRLASIAKNLVKLMTPERNESKDGKQKAKPRGVDMAAERDKRKAQAQQEREKRRQNTLQSKRDPGKAAEGTGKGAAEVGDAGNGEAKVQHEPTRRAEEGGAPPREPDEDEAKQQAGKVWKVGQKVWVRWEERKGEEGSTQQKSIGRTELGNRMIDYSNAKVELEKVKARLGDQEKTAETLGNELRNKVANLVTEKAQLGIELQAAKTALETVKDAGTGEGVKAAIETFQAELIAQAALAKQTEEQCTAMQERAQKAAEEAASARKLAEAKEQSIKKKDGRIATLQDAAIKRGKLITEKSQELGRVKEQASKDLQQREQEKREAAAKVQEMQGGIEQMRKQIQALQAAGNAAAEAARRSREEEECDGRRRAEEEEDQERDGIQLDREQGKLGKEMQQATARECAPERAHDGGSPSSLPKLPDTPESSAEAMEMEESPHHRPVPLSPPLFPRSQAHMETPKRGTRGNSDEHQQTPTMGGRLANIAKNLVKLMTPERNEGAEGRQKAKPRGVDIAAERDKRKAQAQQQREKRRQNTLQSKRDPGKETEGTGKGAAEVGDAGNGEANVQHEPTRSAEKGEAPPREPDEDDTKQQAEKVWKVGQKVWVRWEERKGEEMKFVKATVHAYSATG
eukprot:gene3086-19204_t